MKQKKMLESKETREKKNSSDYFRIRSFSSHIIIKCIQKKTQQQQHQQ